MRLAILLFALPLGAQAQLVGTPKSPTPAETSSVAGPIAPIQLPPIIVTATAEENRQHLDVESGTSTYTLSAGQISTIAQGQNTPFNQVLVRTPGVSLDTYGAVHFRNEDPFYRYYINGTLLPAGINGFDQDIDTRFVESATTRIGALPAFYPEGNYGIVDIETRSGRSLDGSQVTLYGGSHGTLRPTVSYGGTSHGTDYYFTGTYFHNDLGLENPTAGTTAIHDETNQYRGLAYVSHKFEDAGRLSFLFSGSDADYQIPNTPGQGPAFDFTGTGAPPTPVNSNILNETQNEQTYFGFLAYQQTIDDLSFQISQVNRAGTIKFKPDVNGDLFFNGVAAAVDEYVLVNGLQADFTYQAGDAHTIRFGALADTQQAGADTLTTVYSTDPATGTPVGDPFTIGDNHSIRAYDYALYVQDEWRVTKELTINYGLRFEQVKAFTNESQWSPRINAVYQVDKETAVHAGYARYFDPPQLLTVGSSTVGKFVGTTNAPEVTTNDPVKAEKSHYFDAGVTHTFLPGLDVGVDTYYKLATDQIDDGQFGAANIDSPFNYASASTYGVDLSVDYTHGNLSAYGNFAAADSWARNIVSSQFEFAADELALISSSNVRLDQQQFYTASAGVSYRWLDTVFHADAIYGDGIRTGFANVNKLQPYYPVNLGIEHEFTIPNGGVLTVRFDVLNVFDQVYVLNDGTGIGEGAVKYGDRRGFFGGLSYTF